MLPVVIFGAEAKMRGQILAFLDGFSQRNGRRFTIKGNAASMKEAAGYFGEMGAVVLLIIGISAGAGAAAVELERRASVSNRDSYCLYWIEDIADLADVAAQCVHPSGFILPPPVAERFNEIVHRICQDYESLGDTGTEDVLSLQSGGEMFRLLVNEIEYIEALDKKVQVWTSRQCLSVYEKLAHLETLLGARFFRCHRSYLVQLRHIDSVDYAAMEVRLRGGVRIPLSRSAKAALKDRFRREEAAV